MNHKSKVEKKKHLKMPLPFVIRKHRRIFSAMQINTLQAYDRKNVPGAVFMCVPYVSRNE